MIYNPQFKTFFRLTFVEIVNACYVNDSTHFFDFIFELKNILHNFDF